jgi:hypothetical protein
MTRPTLNSRLTILFLTLLLLIAPFCLGYLFYVSSQKSYFTKRNFRVLEGIGAQIKLKVDNLSTSFINATNKAKAEKSNAEARVRRQPALNLAVLQRAVGQVNRYGPNLRLDSTAPPVKQTATPAQTPPPATPAEAPAAKAPQPKASVRLPQKTSKAAPASPTQSPAAAAIPADPVVNMAVRPEKGAFALVLEYRSSRDAASEPAESRVASDIDQLINPLVSRYLYDEVSQTNEHLFDEVLVAQQSDGQVIFTSGESGVRLVNLTDIIASTGKGENAKPSGLSSTMMDVEIAGRSYKFFLQPVQLSIPPSADSTDAGVRWLVGGLVSSSNLTDQTFAVSYTVVIVFLFFLVMALLSMPLLKLKLMGPKDRLTRGNLWSTILSAVLGTSLLTFLLVDSYTYVALGWRLDDQLKILAGDLQRNFRTELVSALNQLRELNDRVTTMAQSGEATGAMIDLRNSIGRTDIPNNSTQACPPSCHTRNDLLANELDALTAPYPFFNSAVWVDPLGHQRIKWTTRPETTAFIPVGDRPYFKNVRDGNLWTIPDESGGQSSTGEHSYSLELVNSRNTGETVTIISTRVPGSMWVSCMDTRLVSLVQTLLPAGYGYCIIDPEGKVLFHSDEVKNLDEHFLEECRYDSTLRSILLARADGFVSTKYLGRGHRLYVTPLADMPWSLVVFRDQQMLRTINLEILTLSSMLFFGFGLLMLALILVRRSARPEDRAKWLWPDPSRRRRYGAIVLLNFLFGLVLLPWMLIGGGWPVILLSVIVPAATLLVFTAREDSRFMAAADRIADRLKLNKVDCSVMYTLAVTTLLLIMSVLPTLAYFKTARDFELTEFMRHGQMSLARGLEARDYRVRQQYSSIKVGLQDEQKDRFLSQRRLEPGWDVYSSFFFDTRETAPNTEAGNGNGTNRFIQSILTALGPLFNQTTVERRGLSREASADQSWRSGGTPYTGMSLLKRPEGDGSRPHIGLFSKMSNFEDIASGVWWGTMLAYAILMLVAVYLFVRFVAKRIFLLDFGPPRVRAASRLQSQSLRQNLVYIGSPLANGARRWSEEHFHVIDLIKVAGTRAIAPVADGVRPGLSIVVENFEAHMADPAANRWKLDLLEHFLQEGRNIVVVSSLSPLSFSLDGPGNSEPAETGSTGSQDDGDYCKRWSEAFSTFAEVYEGSGNNGGATGVDQKSFVSSLRYKPPLAYLERIRTDIQQDLHGDEPTRTEMVDEVADRARPIHQAIWANCSKDEKLTLIHLALDGLINANRPELRSLMKKGLVVRDPALRLVNEAFKRFVVSESQKEDFWAWEKEGARSHWELAKVPLLLILITVGVFLFITQKEFYDSTMTLLSAVTGGVIALFKLLGLFQQKAGPPSPG